MSSDICDTSDRKFVTKTFQKKPNLVALQNGPTLKKSQRVNVPNFFRNRIEDNDCRWRHRRRRRRRRLNRRFNDFWVVSKTSKNVRKTPETSLRKSERVRKRKMCERECSGCTMWRYTKARERERERGRGRRQLPCGTVDSSLETKIFVCPFSLSLWL